MRSRVARFKLEDGLIYFIQDIDVPRLCIPKVRSIRLHILHDHHDAPIAGHLGVDKTYAGVARSYFWPKLTQEVRRYVTSCDACQRNKSSNRQPAGLLQPLDLPGQRWEQVSMDFIVQLPKTKKNFDAIFVVVDRLTKRVHLIPTHTTATAPDTARIFFDNIFRLHGLPKIIISDRDSKFISKFWRSLFKTLGVHLALSTAYHPQTDGQTERANRTLEDMLRTFVNYRQDNWDDCLTTAEFAYKNSVQASSSYSPFYIDCGQYPITPTGFSSRTAM